MDMAILWEGGTWITKRIGGHGYTKGKGGIALLRERVDMAILRQAGHGYIEGNGRYGYTLGRGDMVVLLEMVDVDIDREMGDKAILMGRRTFLY